uniref:Uncharacterized protein n=1 Tax=Acrobeloides nanus TaxID=290746 RepID=A0A914C9L2_9BILA
MQCESQDANNGTINLETSLLYPVLPPNPNFFCCHERYHITAVAKVLSIIYLFIYAVVCALIWKLADELETLIPYNPKIWLCVLIYGLFLLQLFFIYSARLMWREYGFITEVDRYLKSMKRSSSNASKEGKDNDTPFNGSHRMIQDF